MNTYLRDNPPLQLHDTKFSQVIERPTPKLQTAGNTLECRREEVRR